MSLLCPHGPGTTKYLTLNPGLLTISLHFPGGSMRATFEGLPRSGFWGDFSIKVLGNDFFSPPTLPSVPWTNYRTRVNLRLVGGLWHHRGSPPILCDTLIKSQTRHSAQPSLRTAFAFVVPSAWNGCRHPECPMAHSASSSKSHFIKGNFLCCLTFPHVKSTLYILIDPGYLPPGT